MDISRLRKKHKESKEKPEQKEPEAGPEETGISDEHEAEPEAPAVEEEAPASPALEKPVSAEDEAAPAAAEAVPEAPVEEEAAAGEMVELMTFNLSEELYAFRVTDVQEVLRSQKMTVVPRTIDFIPGVTSLRGKVIPVMDLRKRLHISSGQANTASIVILKGAGRGMIGVLVDRTLDVIRVSESDIKRPPSHLADSEARFIEGIAAQQERFISIIDLNELLDFNATGEGR
jgi:purine-binding chemotaxis protein CheW